MFNVARIAVAGTLCLTAIAAPPSLAQNRPAPQRVLSRGVPDAMPVRSVARTAASNHLLYGRIDRIAGPILLVRARNGRLQRVDAGEAIRTGTFSEPLFIGKIVLVSGYYDASRTLRAKSVMRMGELDASTGPDS